MDAEKPQGRHGHLRPSCVLAELLYVEAEFVPLLILLDLVPCDNASALCGLAAHDAGARSLDTCRDLVLELSACNAVDEAAILHGVGLGEITL